MPYIGTHYLGFQHTLSELWVPTPSGEKVENVPCVSIMYGQPRLGIPIFSSNFWAPNWKWNSNSISDSGYFVWIFFEKSDDETHSIWNSNLQNLEFHYFFHVGTKYISFPTYTKVNVRKHLQYLFLPK